MCDRVFKIVPNSIEYSKQGEVKIESLMMVPDHPLLEMFQKALKQHLLSLIDRANEEVHEIETEITKKNVELETTGLQVYQQQQFVCSKQENLGNLIQNVEIIKEKYKKEEEELEQNTRVLKEINAKLLDTQKTSKEITKELEAIRELIYNLTNAEKQIEGHLKVNKTIASKRRGDNETLAKEKKRQDYLIHSLSTDLWKLENEMETLEATAVVKQAYVDDMEEKIAVGNTTISALETEHKCLLQSWNSALLAIGSRDDTLDSVQKKLNVLTNRRKNLENEMYSVKRQMKIVLSENNEMTGMQSNLLREIERNKQCYEQDLIKKDELFKDMTQLECIINETEKDAKRVEEEIKQRQLRLDPLQKELDKLSEKRINLENSIENLFFQQTYNNGLNKKQRRIFEDLIGKRRENDVIIQRMLNKSVAVRNEVEERKLKNEELSIQLGEMKRDISTLNDELDKLSKQVKSQEFIYRKEKTKYKLIKEKLQEMTKRQTEDNVTPNKELKLVELDKLIQDREKCVKELKRIWLSEQNTMIKFAKERQQQIHDMNIKRKQVLMKEQQNMRVQGTLEQIHQEQEHIEISIRRYSIKSQKLCDELYNKRNRKQRLDKDNVLFKNQFEEKLRDAELELLKTESEIAGIEENKLTLSKDLIECNREALAWEAKYKMAKDALMEFNGEKDKGGELNAMKNKLSRGKVFLGELKKSQEKILKELQICISKRDSIFYKSEAKQQQIECKSKTNQGDKKRMSVARKIVDIKNQIKHVNNEMQAIKKMIKLSDEKKMSRMNDVNDISKRLTFTSEIEPVLKTQLEETKTNRQIKFEMLIYHQQKSELYRLLTKNKTPYRKYKNNEYLVSEYNKQKDINRKLTHLITLLENQYPVRRQELVRLFHSLAILYVS